MGNFIKKKNNESFNKILNVSLWMSVIYIILGIFLMFFPVNSIRVVGYVTGSLIILTGFYTGFKFFTRDGAQLYKFNIIFMILEIIAGILLIYYIDEVVDVISIIIGAYLTVFGINKLSYGIWFKIGNEPSWGLIFTVGLMLTIFGILIICNTFSSLALVVLLGVFLFVLGLLDFVSTLLVRRRSEVIVTIFW